AEATRKVIGALDLLPIGRLNARYNQLQKLLRTPGQGVHAFGLFRTGDAGGEDVFAAEGNGAAGEGDGVEEAVVVDCAPFGGSILVGRREIAVVLDAETANLAGTFAQVGQHLIGRQPQVIHDVAGIVVDADTVVIDLARDLGAGRAAACLAA